MSGLWDLFYPNLCVGCHRESVATSELFCVACEHLTTITSLHQIAQNECLRRVPSVSVYRASAMYRFYPGGIIQKVIHEIKYARQPRIAYRMGQKYGDVLSAESWTQEIDVIIPVPLHRKRLRKRGFNQSQFFAEGLADRLKKQVRNDNLQRIKATKTQTRMGRFARLENMRHAFALADPVALTDQHILLVDDVLTTGATIEACLSKLSECAPSKLSFVTMAVAE